MNKKELITEFRKRRLELKADLEKRLEKANLLKGRKRYRSFEGMIRDINFILDMDYIFNIPEDEKALKKFDKTLYLLLNRYFEGIVDLINSCDAWQMLDINKDDYIKEKFDNLKLEEKFRMLYFLNVKYIDFLRFQQTADERDSLLQNSNSEIDEETLKKMSFLEFMFDRIGNENFRNEFIFSMNEEFLSELMKYRKSKAGKLQDFVEGKKKNIQFEFEKFGTFLSEEDFLAIAEAIIMSIDVFKCPKKEVINFFYQISETVSEKRFLVDLLEDLRNLEAKSERIKGIKNVLEKARENERIKKEKAIAEENERKRLEELERIKQEEQKRINGEKNRKLAKAPKIKLDAQIQELEKKIAFLQGMLTAKEAVIPVIFLWTDTQDISLKKKLGSRNITRLFKQLKQIEQEKGIRTSLYLITTANRDITSKRFQELRSIANQNDMPRLVEGAIGAYGSFRIDEAGNVKDRAIMSEENKEAIIYLLENTAEFSMPREMLEASVTDFLRYKFSNGKDKTITNDYLAVMRSRLLRNARIKDKPLKILLYEEKDSQGIDVLLQSQTEGLAKVGEYYRAKYHIGVEKIIKINIDLLEEFLKSDREEEK